jgi:hypothetical protein
MQCLVRAENVRLVPTACTGQLALLSSSKNAFSLEFRRPDERPLYSFVLGECADLVIDQPGSTLFISSLETGSAVPFHFMDSEPAVFMEQVAGAALGLLRKRVTASGTLITYHLASPPAPIGETDVLQALAKVTQHFVSSVDYWKDRVLLQKQKDPEASEHRAKWKRGIPRNPWIVDKPLALPVSSMRPSLHRIPLDSGTLEGMQLSSLSALVYNSLGRILGKATRRAFWKRILQTQTPVSYDHYLATFDQSILSDAESRISRDISRLGATTRQEERVLQNILQAYCVFDPELLYVQGMGDLLMPLVQVFGEEEQSDAFCCFVGLMKRLRTNFTAEKGLSDIDGQLQGIRSLISDWNPILDDYLRFSKDCDKLLFCYRWLLVLFRREFAPEQCISVWDVLLAAEVHCAGGLQEMRRFVGTAMLFLTRDTAMGQCSRFEDLLTVNPKQGLAPSIASNPHVRFCV